MSKKSVTLLPIVAPVHLAGGMSIAKTFRVNKGTVKKWKSLGAPIIYIGGRYQANYMELWQWIRSNCND